MSLMTMDANVEVPLVQKASAKHLADLLILHSLDSESQERLLVRKLDLRILWPNTMLALSIRS